MGRRASIAMALALVLAAGLAGCGQKGPLYLPGDEQAAEQYGPREAAQGDEQSDADDDAEGGEE